MASSVVRSIRTWWRGGKPEPQPGHMPGQHMPGHMPMQAQHPFASALHSLMPHELLANLLASLGGLEGLGGLGGFPLDAQESFGVGQIASDVPHGLRQEDLSQLNPDLTPFLVVIKKV